jgi:cellulose synthase operon protein YhjU
MGLWSLYFLVKLALYGGGYIDFHVGLNLGLALLAALRPKNVQQRFAKNLVIAPLALVLLYHDSWFPPIARVLSQAHNMADFSLPYLFELLGRFINFKVLAGLAALLATYLLLRRKLRMSTFAILGILAVGVASTRSHLSANPVAGPVIAAEAASVAAVPDPRNMRPEALNALLTEFYQKQSSSEVRFQTVGDAATPYDIVLLHVCSLSWDDLSAVNLQDTPLLKRFDLLFTAFNSGASYSGPAAIRLLRGSCGQTPHKQLYDAAAPGCLVIDGLQRAGFEPHWLMNHDGHFGDFFSDVRDRGGMPVTPDSNAGAVVAQHSFDGTPIYDDYSVLAGWWGRRQAMPAHHVVLYYNTVSLHDGNRIGNSSLSTNSSFHLRAERLFDGFGKFLDDLQKSGRHVVVVLIPEHGAAVRGDRKQITGLREIPTPAITQVPVAVALINRVKDASAPQQVINAPASYLALNELLSRFIASDPFAAATSLSNVAQDLPQTESVAENEGTVVMQIGKQFMLRTPDGDWSPWDTGS